MENGVTILTRPISRKPALQRFKGSIKNLLIYLGVLPKSKMEYVGHFAVTRSLIEGLKKLNVNFNYNPKIEGELKEVVVVLSDIDALKQAIELKKNGRIKRLLAGPNLVIKPSDYNGIVASPEIDIYLLPSEWTKFFYEEDCPSLIGRTRLWYAGVNEQYWKNESYVNSNKVLVYWKTEAEDIIIDIEKMLKKYGFIPIRLKYGEYKSIEFKEKLSECGFSIFVSRSESQGIALAEAWAMNISTLVWNPQFLNLEGQIYTNVSSAPWISNKTGFLWKEIGELEYLLKNKDNTIARCSPRSWIEEHMTDIASAKLLIKIIRDLE